MRSRMWAPNPTLPASPGHSGTAIRAAWEEACRLVGGGQYAAAAAQFDAVVRLASGAGEREAALAAGGATSMARTLSVLESGTREIELAHERLLETRRRERDRIVRELAILLSAAQVVSDGVVSRGHEAWTVAAVTVIPFQIGMRLGVIEAERPPQLADVAPAVRVRCLGGFEVEIDGVRIDDWRNAKARLVLVCILVSRQRRVSRQQLMGLFWPDYPQARAANNLSLAIMSARRLIESTVGDSPGVTRLITLEAGHYGLRRDAEVWVDAEAFTEAVERGRRHQESGEAPAAARAFDEALSLYLGEYLAEDGHQEWAAERRRELHDLYLEALSRRSLLALQAAEVEQAIGLAWRLLEQEPTNEEGHRLLMSAYYRRGDRARALQQMQICRDVLARELDVAPSRATLALFEQILRGPNRGRGPDQSAINRS